MQLEISHGDIDSIMIIIATNSNNSLPFQTTYLILQNTLPHVLWDSALSLFKYSSLSSVLIPSCHSFYVCSLWIHSFMTHKYIILLKIHFLLVNLTIDHKSEHSMQDKDFVCIIADAHGYSRKCKNVFCLKKSRTPFKE